MAKPVTIKKKDVTRSTPVEPTIETTPIVIEGKIYRMCFDLGALAEAEDELVARGHAINILDAFPRLNLSSTRIMFAASLRKFHPEISFDEALALLTLPYAYSAAIAIADAWKRCQDEPDKDAKKNPTRPLR